MTIRSRAMLVMERGPATGRSFEITPPCTVGRATNCGVVLEDRDVSRVHCVIEFEANEYTLRDNHSANGTFLNGHKISTAALRTGDVIQAGKTSLRFELGGGAEMETESVVAAADIKLGDTPFRDIGDKSAPAELAAALSKFKALYEVTLLLGRATKFDGFLNLVLEQVLAVLPADEAAVILGGTPESATVAARLARKGTAAAPLVSGTVLSRVFAGESLMVEDVHLDERLHGSESLMSAMSRSLIVAPIHQDGVVAGALQLQASRHFGAFSRDDLHLLAAIAHQVSNALATLKVNEQRDAALRKAQLRRFVSLEDAERIIQAPEHRWEEGGEARIVTLFADLRGIMEAVATRVPVLRLEAINLLLAPLVDRVWAHRGTIGALTGEGVLAFWGSPIGRSDSPRRAITAALEMAREFRAAAEKCALPERNHALSLGLDVGLALTGNVGAGGRSDFLAIGPPVAAASRLARLAAGTVRVSATLREELGDFVDATSVEGGFEVSAILPT